MRRWVRAFSWCETQFVVAYCRRFCANFFFKGFFRTYKCYSPMTDWLCGTWSYTMLILSKNNKCITFPTLFWTYAFLGRGQSVSFHWQLCCFVSPSKWWNKLSLDTFFLLEARVLSEPAFPRRTQHTSIYVVFITEHMSNPLRGAIPVPETGVHSIINGTHWDVNYIWFLLDGDSSVPLWSRKCWCWSPLRLWTGVRFERASSTLTWPSTYAAQKLEHVIRHLHRRLL